MSALCIPYQIKGMSVLCTVSDKGYICSLISYQIKQTCLLFVRYQIKGVSALCTVSEKGMSVLCKDIR